MSLEGTVINGQIVLDGGATLPDGMRVVVNQAEEKEGEAQPTLLGLLKLAGIAKDLPVDFAAQHDHYLHGKPKR